MCSIKSRTVIGRLGARSPDVVATLRSAKLGMYFETGSSTAILPASTRLSAAAVVMALLME